VSGDFSTYDSTRDFSRKAVRSLCYAPHTNLFFDRLGSARVCCWNWSQPAGNITRQTLDEIWSSAQATMLRSSLERYELASGCGFCKFQTLEGWTGGVKMRQFDRFEVTETPPQWPRQIEFSISNACNLECVMCDGEHSSAIRAHREGRAPQARLYTDAVLEQFRPYLPYLTQAKFLGGEPFLATEHFKIWDMMIAQGANPLCHVTTNGTQYNGRIARVLEKLPFGFAISLDGARKQTIERLRFGAKYDDVMRNLKQFHAYAREKRTSFSLTFCLMRPNWAEFGEFCEMAESWNVRASVNTVLHPPGLSLYSLPADELRRVVHAMEREAPRLATSLHLNKRVWFDEFERLTRKMADQPAEAPRLAPAPASQNAIVLGVDAGDADFLSINLHFLQKFSKATLVVAQTGPDQPDALRLRTTLFTQLSQATHRALFLSATHPPPTHDIDAQLTNFTPPLAFARTAQEIDEASPSLVNCGCTSKSCGHAREALLCLLGADITDCAWKLPNPSHFSATRAAIPHLTAWHDLSTEAGKNNYWRDPLRAGLIAMLWKHGLADWPALG
jgi:MoaA/NifB/PqqE/SkfB family radical SAM enzyme